jgi:lipoyl(octanoyl) transferase
VSIPELWVCQLGTVPYADALELQREVRAARQADAIPDVLLVLEHEPVYTLGRRASTDDLQRGEAWYREQGIATLRVDRGGHVTYHGPGQLVAYPIVRTDSARDHVATMQRAMVSALADEGVAANTRDADGAPYLGVWAGGGKIGSVGVRVQRGVTTHGLAINVTNDLAPFEWVVACGLPDVRMVSVASVTGRDDDMMHCLRKRLAWRYAIASGRRQRLVSETRLREALAPLALPTVA